MWLTVLSARQLPEVRGRAGRQALNLSRSFSHEVGTGFPALSYYEVESLFIYPVIYSAMTIEVEVELEVELVGPAPGLCGQMIGR